jgi:hypothetical protein
MVAERASAFQQCQIGLESTAGTAVAATVNLQSISITPKPAMSVQKFRPQGKLFPTVVALGKDYTTASISGTPCFEEIGHIFASVLAKGTATEGVTPYTIDSDAPNDPQTYTVEFGPAGGAGEKFAYGIITGLGLKWTREAFELSGDMIGRAMADMATITTVAAADVTPILPGNFDFYLSDGVAGTTKLTRCFSVDVNISGRWQAIWPADSSTTGFPAIVEAIPEGSIKMLLEADTQGKTPLATIRAGNATKYFIMHAEVTGGYELDIEMAVKVGEPEEFKDEGGVYAIGHNLVLVDSADLGGGSAIVATVTIPAA